MDVTSFYGSPADSISKSDLIAFLTVFMYKTCFFFLFWELNFFLAKVFFHCFANKIKKIFYSSNFSNSVSHKKNRVFTDGKIHIFFKNLGRLSWQKSFFILHQFSSHNHRRENDVDRQKKKIFTCLSGPLNPPAHYSPSICWM